jgi:hypothetical protein
MGERSGALVLSRFVVPLERSRRVAKAWLNQSRETPASTRCSDNAVAAASGQYMNNSPKVVKGRVIKLQPRPSAGYQSDYKPPSGSIPSLSLTARLSLCLQPRYRSVV